MTIRCLRCGQKTPGLSLCWRRAASNGARLRKPIKADAVASLDGRLVVGIDEDGARYFKRLRCHDCRALFADGVAQIREVLIHGNYLSKEDIDICLDFRSVDQRGEAVPGPCKRYLRLSLFHVTLHSRRHRGLGRRLTAAERGDQSGAAGQPEVCFKE